MVSAFSAGRGMMAALFVIICIIKCGVENKTVIGGLQPVKWLTHPAFLICTNQAELALHGSEDASTYTNPQSKANRALMCQKQRAVQLCEQLG